MVIDFVTVGDFNNKLDRVLSVYAAVVMPDGGSVLLRRLIAVLSLMEHGFSC